MLDELGAAIVSGDVIGVTWDKGSLAASDVFERPDCTVVVRLRFHGRDGREWTVEPTADGSEIDSQWLTFSLSSDREPVEA